MDDEVIESGTPAPAVTEAVEKQAVETIDKGTAPELDGEEKQAEPAKTFTQAEVDAAIQKRLLKAERQMHRRVEQQTRDRADAQTREVAPNREAYRDDEAYLNAQIEHLAEKRAAEKFEQRERQSTQDKSQEAFLERAEATKAKYSDFDAVVGNQALSINQGMAEFISDSDIGPEVAYFLGKNPMKAQEIAAMTPMKAARELSAIEAQVSAKPPVRTSNAPAPITPIGNRGGATPTIANSDFAEYKKLRASQGARWSR